jgi:hypothetical protein
MILIDQLTPRVIWIAVFGQKLLQTAEYSGRTKTSAGQSLPNLLKLVSQNTQVSTKMMLMPSDARIEQSFETANAVAIENPAQ